MLDPPQAVAGIVYGTLHLLTQERNCFLRLPGTEGVEAFQVLIVLFVNEAADEILIECGLELPRFLQLYLAIGNPGLELCDLLPADLLLANAVQQPVQGNGTTDMGLQALQHTGGQVAFFQHNRVCAAVFSAGGAVIVNVLFAVHGIGLAGHAPAAGTADQQAGEQIDRLSVRRSAGVKAQYLLHQMKIPF